MGKRYLTANEYLRDCYRLAHLVKQGSWHPEIVLGIWRGGALAAVAMHEYLTVAGISCKSAVIKCSSYTGIATRESVVTFEYAEEFFSTLQPGTRVLVVDDVFDSGETCRAVHRRLLECGAESRMATVYWKPNANQTELKPDYYVSQVDEWIVFPQELDGLSPEELEEKNVELAQMLSYDCGQKLGNSCPER